MSQQLKQPPAAIPPKTYSHFLSLVSVWLNSMFHNRNSVSPAVALDSQRVQQVVVRQPPRGLQDSMASGLCFVCYSLPVLRYKIGTRRCYRLIYLAVEEIPSSFLSPIFPAFLLTWLTSEKFEGAFVVESRRSAAVDSEVVGARPCQMQQKFSMVELEAYAFDCSRLRTRQRV